MQTIHKNFFLKPLLFYLYVDTDDVKDPEKVHGAVQTWKLFNMISVHSPQPPLALNVHNIFHLQICQ